VRLTSRLLADLPLRVHQHMVAVTLQAIGVVAGHKGVHSFEIKEATRKQAIDDLTSESFSRLVEELYLAIHGLHHDHVLPHYTTEGAIDHVV
jgi:hypothetical protein